MSCVFSTSLATRWTGVSLILLIGMVVSGCSGSQSPYQKAAVQGKVIAANGEPLTEGEVTFTSPEMGVGATMPIATEGAFVVPANIRVGKYIVTVTPPPIVPGSPDDPGISGADLKRFDALIPMAYRKELTTPLKDYEVVEGQNHFEIRLNPL